MNNFLQIPTDKFKPISYDNNFLFTHYEKIANFLAFNLERNFKSILAKPIQIGYDYQWLSNYNNLVSIETLDTENKEKALNKYWEFRKIVNVKIKTLANSNIEDSQYWSNLLAKVFDHRNNYIYTNGNEICIVWGWEFNNDQNYEPVFRESEPKIIENQNIAPEPEPVVGEDVVGADLSVSPDPIASPEVYEEETKTEELEPENELENEEDKEEEIEEEREEEKEELPKKPGFIEFLRYIASKYWWVLVVLITMIALIFFYKTLTFNLN